MEDILMERITNLEKEIDSLEDECLLLGHYYKRDLLSDKKRLLDTLLSVRKDLEKDEEDFSLFNYSYSSNQ